MKFLRYFLPGSILLMSCLLSVLSCSKKGEPIESRIAALTAKGVPDSVLSNVKVYLYNTTSLKKTGQYGKARAYGDSLKIGIKAAETWYETTMQTSKPYIETLRATLTTKIETLSGLPRKDADSLLSVIDSFSTINWLIQAKNKLDKLDTIMPILLQNEATAKTVLTKLTGTWRDVHVIRAEEDNFKATQRRTYKFAKDGAYEGSEAMVGQTTPYMKEDWKFLSWGTFDLMGDTIYLNITREKCTRQVFTQLNVKENKWTRNVKPTYDSTITDGSKNRFITFNDLKLEFKKK